MSNKRNGVKHSMRVPVKSRRQRVIGRLESQLKSGTKNTKEGRVQLTDKDVKRINKELDILKKRV